MSGALCPGALCPEGHCTGRFVLVENGGRYVRGRYVSRA